jgi:hypothetical protein
LREWDSLQFKAIDGINEPDSQGVLLPSVSVAVCHNLKHLCPANFFTQWQPAYLQYFGIMRYALVMGRADNPFTSLCRYLFSFSRECFIEKKNNVNDHKFLQIRNLSIYFALQSAFKSGIEFR